MFLLVLLFLATGAPAVIREASKQRAPCEYVPNEILIKFRKPMASAIEEQLGLERSADKLKLSRRLGVLNARYRIKEIKPVFKGFKKNRQRLNALLKKDKATLTKKEKHILRRLKRAPKDAKVPDLSRIYKIELDLDTGESLEKAVQAYNNHPDVEYAELSHIVSIHLAPGDPYYLIQWPLNNVGQDYPVTGGETASGTSDADIDAPEAWDIETGSPEVMVAVVDTGVDYNHRDLQANMWTDANGHYGRDFFNGDNDPMDDNGHGTHCAGIIAASTNNGLDIAGVCGRARIIAVKFLGPDGWGLTIDAMSALYYAVDNGADVISNSWGGASDADSLQETIEYAYSQGVIVVAAAGNDNTDSPTYPANNDHVIAVAATDSDDQKASFSNYGEWVDIAAPGVDVLSLRASNTDMYLGSPGYLPCDRFVPYRDPRATLYIASGTSMACPHVAGASALLLSLNPALMSDELYDILMQTVDPIQAGICLSDGRLNLCNAVAAAIPSKGHLSLDRDYYSCSGAVSVVLVDRDLMGIGTQAVTFTTSGGDWEIIILNEKTPAVGVFSGTVYTSAGDPNAGDGKLQVAHEQIIAVTYYDANDGTGTPSVETDAATTDCEPPVISDVEVEVPGPEPKVIFRTNEPTAARVSCRLSCAEPNIIVAAHSRSTTSHTVRLTGVSPITDYYFLIEATDVAGNRTIDDNNGACHAFSTDGPRDIHVPIQCLTIQEAIDISWDGGTVVVADGTYTGPGNRDLDFKAKAVTLRSENGPANCIIDCQGSFTTPHCGFYFHNAEDALSVLNGFTITRGYANNEGAGIKCVGSSPKITNCIIAENLAVYCGGGMDNYVSNPILTDCVFTRNTVGVWPNDFFGGGAGMRNFLSSPTLRNCTFTENRGISGGAMYNEYSNPMLANCTFIGNQAYVHDGGAIWNLSSSPKLTNCTFSGNKGGQGGAIFCADGSNATVTDCILWDDWAVDGNEIALHAGFQEGASSVTVSYSDIQGGATGVYVGGDSRINWEAGNIDDDPDFVQRGRWDPNGFWLAGDYHLLAGSPCIDAGDPNSDWGYEPWPNGGRVNMGAYGNTKEATRSSADFEDLAQICAYWLEYDPLLDIAPEPAGDGIINFLDFAVFANCWLW